MFDLNVGYARFRNPVALAPMAGITDSSFAKRFAPHAGLVSIGGYNLDEKTAGAAREEVKRGRREFIITEPLEHIRKELDVLKDCGTCVSVNVRASSEEPYVEAACVAKEYGAIIELNAHCRQPGMMALGAGEALLHDIPRLAAIISKMKSTGAVVSVKTRANVVNDAELAVAIEEAGADIIHIDAMRAGEGHDVRVIRATRNLTDLFIIGNNSVVDFESAKELFSYGADMVSIGRAVLRNPDVVRQVALETEMHQQMTGWYNAPKHICAGGDLRALAFCCLPVKPCVLHGALKQAGITAEEFMAIKLDFAKGTPIEHGEGTCFGSMTWCCKITKPCFLRDGALETASLSDVEYMQLKKQLSRHILKHRKRAR